MTSDDDRPVRNAELKSELKSMRSEFRLWLVIAIAGQQVIPLNEVAKAAINVLR